MRNIFPRFFFVYLRVKIKLWDSVLGLVLQLKFEFRLDLSQN